MVVHVPSFCDYLGVLESKDAISVKIKYTELNEESWDEKLNTCDRCKNQEATISLTSDSGCESLCMDCYNEMASNDLGVTLEKHPETISLQDDQGVSRHFKIEQRLLPIGLFLEAEETIRYGYKFAVHGEVDCIQSALFQKLVDKMKRGISKQYIEEQTFPNGQKYQSMVNHQLVGRIEYNAESEDVPLMIIDGRPYTWDELGKIMTSSEGFQLQLKIINMTEEAE